MRCRAVRVTAGFPQCSLAGWFIASAPPARPRPGVPADPGRPRACAVPTPGPLQCVPRLRLSVPAPSSFWALGFLGLPAAFAAHTHGPPSVGVGVQLVLRPCLRLVCVRTGRVRPSCWPFGRYRKKAGAAAPSPGSPAWGGDGVIQWPQGRSAGSRGRGRRTPGLLRVLLLLWPAPQADGTSFLLERRLIASGWI